MSDGLPARAAALAVLSDVLRKRRPARCRARILAYDGAARCRLRRVIASETLRRLGQIETIVRHFVPKAPQPHKAGPTLEILYAGACELLFLDVPAHAAVDAANRLAQADAKAVHFKSLINAVLRRVSREGKPIAGAQDAARLKHARLALESLVRRLWRGDGARHRGVACAAGAHRYCPQSRRHPGACGRSRIRDCPSLDGGRTDRCAARFRGGQLVGAGRGGDLAGAAVRRCAGQTVIDLCAAPGGKTMQLAAAGANVIAVEREAARLERVRENLRGRNSKRCLCRPTSATSGPLRPRLSSCSMRPAPQRGR
ncbi:MAG: transcription antitermination factor NusB [Rhizomicrobium sp.]